jgi:anti-sigma factor RsiW
MTAAEGPLTRSRIEAFDQTAAALANFAAQWRAQAEQLQQAANVYVEQVNNPNGTAWNGHRHVLL